MAQDVSGKTLAVGQKVAYCMPGKAQAMRVSTVTVVMPRTVELLDKPYPSSNWGIRRNHGAVSIIE